ncbi:MAG: hypothetical protein HFJ59_02640 [Clostridia bacterium]|nr:hypothetical protein [Clostridia bacterium]
MFQRIIIVCVVTVLFSGGVIKNIITQKKEKEDTVVETEEILNEKENVIDEEIAEAIEDTSNETTSEINNQGQDNNTENIIEKEIKKTTDTVKKDNDTKKGNPKPTTTNTGNQKSENKRTSNQVKPNQEVQKTETNNNKEPAKSEKITEEYIYNDTETKRLISDIDTIAKRNPDLWGKNGEKLYKIQKSPSLVGKNYMYPYSFSQIEGKVLNVYSVTFLVYAADYKKTGFPTQTRYFVDITNY